MKKKSEERGEGSGGGVGCCLSAGWGEKGEAMNNTKQKVSSEKGGFRHYLES